MPVTVKLTLTQPVTGLEVYDLHGSNRQLNQPGDYSAGDVIEVTVHSTVCCDTPQGRLKIRGNGAPARLTVSGGTTLWP
jgi:hypothetical protein